MFTLGTLAPLLILSSFFSLRVGSGEERHSGVVWVPSVHLMLDASMCGERDVVACLYYLADNQEQ